MEQIVTKTYSFQTGFTVTDDSGNVIYEGWDETAADRQYNITAKNYWDNYRQSDEYKNWANENPTEAAQQEWRDKQEYHKQGILNEEEENEYQSELKRREQKEKDIQSDQQAQEEATVEEGSLGSTLNVMNPAYDAFKNDSSNSEPEVEPQEFNRISGDSGEYTLQAPFNMTDPWVYHDPSVGRTPVARLIEQQNAVLGNEKGVGANEDRNTTNVEAIEYPVIKVNNTELDEHMIEYMCITYRDFYPTLYLRVFDQENRISFADVPGPNNVITVVLIPSNQGVYKSISIDFYVDSCVFDKDNSTVEYSATYKFLPFEQKFTGQVKYPGCPNTKGKITGSNNEGTGTVSCNPGPQTFPNFWETLHEICLKTGLGFATTDQVKEIEDRLPRTIVNLNFREYILSQLYLSGVDENSVFDVWIDLYRYLVIVNVAWVFDYDITFRHLTIKSNVGLNGTDEDTPETRTKLVHRTLTNFTDMVEPSDLEFNADDFEEIVNTDQAHKGFSQQCNTLDVRGVSGMNSVSPQDVEIMENSIDGKMRDEYNTFVENMCQSRVDVQYNTNVQTDVRKDFFLRHRSRMYRLKLRRPNFGLYRGTLVNISYFTTSSTEKQAIMQQSDNMTGSKDVELAHPETGTEHMDNHELIQNQGIPLPVLTKSGLYYIDGMTFEYRSETQQIEQTLYLIKRGNLTSMQNKHTSPKLDGDALGKPPEVSPSNTNPNTGPIVNFIKIG